jgi:ABC-type branched-subunit amino acid transport system ATPase component
MLLAEHDMSFVVGGLRRIMDLNFGTIVGSGPTDDIRASVVRELDLTYGPARSSAAQGPSR